LLQRLITPEQPWPTSAFEPHAALCPVSCGSYLNTVFIRVQVAKFVPVVHLESRGVTYKMQLTHALRGSVLCGLCKHMHSQAHLRDTRVSYRFARKRAFKEWGDVHACPCVWCGS